MSTRIALPDVDFRRLRPYGSPASRADGFEELVSILIREGLAKWPPGTTFFRFGNPDGGREGKGVLPGGDVWVWQAKYLFEFGDSEIGQVHKSVIRVLDSEPNLKRLYVALPYDLPAGDVDRATAKRKSAYTKWTEKKAEWESLAADRGMNVEFLYLGAHDLVSELTKPEHMGRLRYWFDVPSLCQESLKQRLADVIVKAGRRYTPQLHVEVEAVQVLEALGRTDSYVRRVQVALAGLRAARGEGWYAPEDEGGALNESIEACGEALAAAEIAMQGFLEAATGGGTLPDIIETVRAVEPAVDAVHRLLQERHLTDGRYYVGQAGALYATVTKTQEAFWSVMSFLRSADTAAARDGRVLMTGRAGVGKTHLFCDVASRRISAGLPTLMVLGQDFDSGRLLSRIGELVQIDGTLDEVLAVLDAAGEAAGCYAMLMVDAVNEGAAAERWVDELRVLSGAVGRHPNVVLAVSCRTEFVTPVVGDADGFPRVEHRGFAEATAQAVVRYTTEYKLERLTFPVLNPEYGNPLFLKLACEALATLGQTRFALGTAGLITVCDAFLEAVNKRLAVSSRCDFDVASNLVQAVVRKLADTGPGPYGRAETVAITESLLPGRTWSKSLLLGLMREGVLMYTYNNHIAFSYQRLGDVFRAVLLAEKPAADLSAWYRALGNDRWAERGTLGALAVIAPESAGEEIVDLFKDEATGRVDYGVIDAFVESLVLRDPEHTTDRTIRIVRQLVDSQEWSRRLWEQLVRVACVRDHRINAEWTHKLLTARPIADRDLSWSEWLIGTTEHDSEYGGEAAVNTLLDWAWPMNVGDDAITLDEDVARLATLILGWMLTTPDRRVRDRATKALVSVGERGAIGFAAGVRQFRGCDDPFVLERLAGAVCAVAQRSTNAVTVITAASAAEELISAGWPENLLTRDYLRRISAAARAHGWHGPEWLPPYGAKWPVDVKSYDAIEDMASAPEYGYFAIWGSVHGQFGDFGRYIVQPAIEHFDVPDRTELRHLVERFIFTRTLDLGWTPERFGHVDRGRGGGREGPVERYGKKYQWIALYEALGRLTDNFQLKERWGKNANTFAYEYPEQLIYRDIDPTVLLHGGLAGPGDQEGTWFAPTHATFPDEVVTGYPTDLDGVPDPLDLIALTSPDGTEWLSMMTHANWTQVLQPEIAALKAPNMNVWMQIRGYLVPSTGAEALRTWLEGPNSEGKDWDGRWMPENAEVHSCLLGAHPHSPEWDSTDGNTEPPFGQDRDIPPLLQPAAWYGGTGTGRGASGLDEPTGFVPTRMLFDLLDLRPGRDFRWEDAAGLAVTDPAAGMEEASTLLMRRDLAARLGDAGYNLFWTVLLNKQKHEHGLGRPGNDYRWISASASYLMTGVAVELVTAKAWRRKPVPGGDPKPVPWSIATTG